MNELLHLWIDSLELFKALPTLTEADREIIAAYNPDNPYTIYFLRDL